VVSVNRTRVRRLRRASARLSGTRLRLVGLVVNRTARREGYYGEYAYGGHRPYGVQAEAAEANVRRLARQRRRAKSAGGASGSATPRRAARKQDAP
jgi:hypothetical protein